MRDYLSNIAARSLNLAEVVQPRPRSTFEPMSLDTVERVPAPAEGVRRMPADMDGNMETSQISTPLKISSTGPYRGSVEVQEREKPLLEADAELPPKSGVQDPISGGKVAEMVRSIASQSRRPPGGPGMEHPGGMGRGIIGLAGRRTTGDAHSPSPDLEITAMSKGHLDNISTAIRGIDGHGGNSASVPNDGQAPSQGPVIPAKAQKLAESEMRAETRQASSAEPMRVPDYIRASSYIKASEPLEKQTAGGDILVSIGRIEVRSSTNAPAPQRRQDASPSSAPMSMKEYLYRRTRGGIG
ncbi:MAG TPA: hypothetical protein VN455_02080 [Methanotrichaceae archaeon]|nr:hypothetical protein [Methanotrichaceae archaeon]